MWVGPAPEAFVKLLKKKQSRTFWPFYASSSRNAGT